MVWLIGKYSNLTGPTAQIYKYTSEVFDLYPFFASNCINISDLNENKYYTHCGQIALSKWRRKIKIAIYYQNYQQAIYVFKPHKLEYDYKPLNTNKKGFKGRDCKSKQYKDIDILPTEGEYIRFAFESIIMSTKVFMNIHLSTLEWFRIGYVNISITAKEGVEGLSGINVKILWESLENEKNCSSGCSYVESDPKDI